MNSTISVMPTAFVGAARARQFAAVLRERLRRAGLSIWAALEAHGRTQALHELRNLHDRWETSDPELAQQTRSASRFLMGAPHR